MTRVAILPERGEQGVVSYRAMAGQMQTVGKTAGEALDLLAAKLPTEESGTLVVVQYQLPDRYFTADQQDRLRELMARWRAARDRRSTISVADQAELDALTEAELRAATVRAEALRKELAQ